MSELRIVSNYHRRPIVYGFELTEEERSEFDYYDSERILDVEFVRYKGQLIDLCDIERPYTGNPFPKFWHAYVSEGFFSGILVHYCALDFDGEDDFVIMGWYYC